MEWWKYPDQKSRDFFKTRQEALKPESEFQDGLRRVQNLATYVALGGTAGRKGLPYTPDFSWAIVGKGHSA